jgi:GTP pyrophosphokinase
MGGGRALARALGIEPVCERASAKHIGDSPTRSALAQGERPKKQLYIAQKQDLCQPSPQRPITTTNLPYMIEFAPSVLNEYKPEEMERIQAAYQHLLSSIRSVVHEDDRKNIDKAFDLALKSHAFQRRKSGEPYIFHPIEVARITAAELGLGPTAVIAALLHDVVEDTDITLKDIEGVFGSKIAMIVDGLTKIENMYEKKEVESPQAENFKKILLTISKDVRVVLIKMADRLHNMRTLDSMRKDKQQKIAYETSFIYAPLAHRLGFYNIKTELEDLSMKYNNPEEYEFIYNKLQETKDERRQYIENFIAPIQKDLQMEGLKFRIFGRVKSISSIANKLNKKMIPFEEIYDIFAIRVILNVPKDKEKSACWHVYSVITDHYTPVPERLKDWISTPKSNGYESLHTTVMGPKGRFVEVQIRSERMDEIAELGFAAHWKYKGISSQESIFEDWLSKAREVLENPSNDAIDFLNDFKANLFAEEVFVFTPKGDMKIFPKGSTALDFAFEIHSEVGYHCKGVKVDQRIVPISYELRNGDQLSVITNPSQKPAEDWLKIVKTAKARNKIRQALREEKLRLGSMGKETLERKLKSWKIPITEENLETISRFFGMKTRLDFYFNIFKEMYNLSDLKAAFQVDQNGKLVPLVKEEEKQVEKEQSLEIEASPAPSSIQPLATRRHFKGKPKLLIDGEDASKYNHSFASCCNPIPGDEIFAYISAHQGVKIHRMTCPNSENIHAMYGYRIRRAEWIDTGGSTEFVIELLLTGIDNIGIVQKLSDVITNKVGLNMKSFSMNGEEGHFEGKIRLVVNSKEQVDQVIREFKQIEEVQTVVRID